MQRSRKLAISATQALCKDLTLKNTCFFKHWKVRKRPCAHNSVSVLNRQGTAGFAQKAVNTPPTATLAKGSFTHQYFKINSWTPYCIFYHSIDGFTLDVALK